MPKLNITVVWKLLVCFALPIAVLMMPIDAIPIDDLTLIQHRLLAIFLLAALLWVLEPVPVFATSILIIALELIMISDKGLHLFRSPPEGHELGELIRYTDIFSAFSSPLLFYLWADLHWRLPLPSTSWITTSLEFCSSLLVSNRNLLCWA